MKLMKLTNRQGEQVGYLFHCPGCGHGHSYHVEKPNGGGHRWTFNGNMDSPTFAPSLLVNPSYPEHRCHLYVRDGKIQFLGDCHHDLAGKTVDMVDTDAADGRSGAVA